MTTTFREVRPDEIHSHPRNIRRDIGDITELTASVKAKGVVEPLIVASEGSPLGLCGDCVLVHRIDADGKLAEHTRGTGHNGHTCEGSGKNPAGSPRGSYVLLAGHRRLAAAKAAGLDVVPCIVRDDLTDPAEQIETMLVENTQRTDLSPIEEGAAYQALLEFDGYTLARVANATGRAAKTVRARIALAKLDEPVRSRIHAGQITLEQAADLASFADDPKTFKKLEKAAGTESWRWELQAAKNARKRAQDAAKARKQLEAEGVRVLDGDVQLYGSHATVKRLMDSHYDLGVRMPVAEHASWPCHAALAPQSSDVTYVCTDPAAHADPDNEDGDDATAPESGDVEQPGKDPVAERRAAEQDRAAAREQLTRDLEIAAGLRREFLDAVMARPLSPAHASAVHRVVLITVLDVMVDDVEADWLRAAGVTEPEWGDDVDEYDARRDLLHDTITARDPAHLGLALLAALNEPALTRATGWDVRARTWEAPDRHEKAYLDLLEHLGYEWSPFEAQLRCKAVAQAAADTENDDVEVAASCEAVSA